MNFKQMPKQYKFLTLDMNRMVFFFSKQAQNSS